MTFCVIASKNSFRKSGRFYLMMNSLMLTRMALLWNALMESSGEYTPGYLLTPPIIQKSEWLCHYSCACGLNAEQ